MFRGETFGPLTGFQPKNPLQASGAMQISKTIYYGVLIILTFLLAGCGGQTATQSEQTDSSTLGEPGGRQSGVGDGSTGDLTEFGRDDAMGGVPAETIIYFEFDRSEILPEYGRLLAKHALYLASNPQGGARLEGHTDERGTREYNIGLGERRAQAVRQLLMIQGVAAAQMTTVSFGEERPVRDGSSESAYSKNRRVEIVHK